MKNHDAHFYHVSAVVRIRGCGSICGSAQGDTKGQVHTSDHGSCPSSPNCVKPAKVGGICTHTYTVNIH